MAVQAVKLPLYLWKKCRRPKVMGSEILKRSLQTSWARRSEVENDKAGAAGFYGALSSLIRYGRAGLCHKPAQGRLDSNTTG